MDRRRDWISRGEHKVDEIPYDFLRKRLSVVVANIQGANTLITKGALKNVLPNMQHTVNYAGNAWPARRRPSKRKSSITMTSGVARVSAYSAWPSSYGSLPWIVLARRRDRDAVRWLPFILRSSEVRRRANDCRSPCPGRPAQDHYGR